MDYLLPRVKFTLHGSVDDDGQPVIVPRNENPIVTTLPDRAERLHKHLVALLCASRPMADTERLPPLERDSFAVRVARTACALCRGWCCRNGEDHGFLDEPTLARVWRVRPEMTVKSMLQLYGDRIPAEGYSGSCIFHGKNGCTLDRALRSDVCNDYFCGGLHGYLTSEDARTPVIVIAGEGDEMRTSPVLVP
jgi:hypothetical protein